MSFLPLNIIQTKAVVLLKDHVDTDQIIPARFLKATTRDGFGDHLFDGWRYAANGEPTPSFILNTPDGVGELLISGENFGCGSSREHAAWALYDYGFRAVLAKSFADIFKSNALNNGLLPIQLKNEEYEEVLNLLGQGQDLIWEVSVADQTLKISGATEIVFSFDLNPFRKKCLLEGTDLVDYLISQKDVIETYESKRI